MSRMKTRKYFISVVAGGTVFIAGLVLFAFVRTWGKTEIEFRIHINEELVRQSAFGESPTFAVWIEDPATKETQTIFVTGRAGTGDWEGKADVPVALPKWFEIKNAEEQAQTKTARGIPGIDAVTGATPQPGYFTTRVEVVPGSQWNCYIEVNLAGDFNEYYQVYDDKLKTSDEYMTGQPALLYKAEITAAVGRAAIPELIGMSILDHEGKNRIKPLEGISTATDIFDEMKVWVRRPKPYLFLRNKGH